MGFYQLKTEQFIPASVEEVWAFISSPKNLKHITPAYMGFDILTPDIPEKMYTGLVIGYAVRPLLGIKTKWLTEITHVEDKKYFIDEQRMGPYKMWHHEHILTQVENGVMLKDIITYIPPFGPLGDLMNTLLIKGQLKKIFDYRFKAVDKKFSK
jgi:ligand-binding SRPBCC domain-containing protein